MSSRIIGALNAYDGKHTDPLDRCLVKSPTRAELNLLLDLFAESEKNQDAASWLLRAWVRKLDTHYDVDIVERWLERTKQSSGWAPALHFTQCMHDHDIQSEMINDIATYFTDNITHKNKMVRAWSISGLAHLATQDPSLVKQAEAATLSALNSPTESASVKARARKAQKLLEAL